MKGGVMIMDILLGRCPTGLAACVQENHLFLICHTCRTPHPHRSFKPPLLNACRQAMNAAGCVQTMFRSRASQRQMPGLPSPIEGRPGTCAGGAC
jgi:hypothetical protein